MSTMLYPLDLQRIKRAVLTTFHRRTGVRCFVGLQTEETLCPVYVLRGQQSRPFGCQNLFSLLVYIIAFFMACYDLGVVAR
jgi:hypothetical protein